MADKRNQFDEQVTARRRSLAGELWDFLVSNKKWWLLPIVLVFVVFGLLMLVGSSPAAPFIYTLF